MMAPIEHAANLWRTDDRGRPAAGENAMRRRCILPILLLVALGSLQAAARTAKDEQPAPYFPDATWQHKAPSEAGIDPGLLQEAIAFAIAAETKAPRDQLKDHDAVFGREPYDAVIGPFKDRGDPTGLVIRHGCIVAEWGDPRRVDMAHSVTKSFLSSVVGVAVDRGLIRSVDDIVRDDM